MAFFPNTADPVPIILHHTASDTATPSLLYAGETAVCHGPTHTKMWIGDGTANRMLLSTNPADSPLLNQSVLGGPFLPLSGGTLTGPGNLTLDGGTLTVSGAYPGVTLDVTGTTPRQWRMEAEDYWWGLTTGDGVWPFYMARNPGPPVSYRLDVRGNLYIREALTVEQDADIWGFLDAQQNLLVRNWVEPTNGGIVHLRRTTPVDVAGAHLGSAIGLGFPVFTWDPPGVEPQTVSARPGAEIRFNSTKAWLRNDVYDPNPPHDLLSSTEELGAEINFFVTRNGEGLPYRAMTLQQDGNLSLPHAVPTAATDVVTLGYLTGAGTGFLSLTGGTLSGPGNLAVNGTLAVSNSDTVSATITNTGNGATSLKINALAPSGFSHIGIDVSAGSGYALSASGQVWIDSLGTTWWFSSSLQGATTNVTSNLLNLRGDGGGILIQLDTRAVDPPGVYAFGVSRHSTSDTCAFIQMFDVKGYGLPIPSDPGNIIGSIWFGGYDGTSAVYPFHPQVLKSAAIYAEPTETWSGTANGSHIVFQVTPNGTTTAQTALTVENDLNVTVTGTVTASGSLLTSDPALKEISSASADALAKVCELPVINFRWKHRQDGKLHRGFSADDVARVMGEESGCSGKGAYSLADMNAVLWAAVQELAAEVRELRNRVH